MDFSDSALQANLPQTTAGQSQEGGKAIRGDIGMLSSGYFLLIFFSIVVLSHFKLTKSNSVISIFSVVSVAMAVISAFGICGYVGVKQNPVVSVLYLLLLGIGIDDTYVIMGALLRVNDADPRERVVKALSRAGASITVTSVTNIVAFAAGMTSSLPALRDFCIFASLGIFFDFLYQCTFLTAIIFYREKWGGPDWLCCIQADPERTGCCSCRVPVCSRGGRHVCCPCTFEVQGKRMTITQYILNAVTKFTLSPIGNVVVLVFTSAIVAGACTGLPLLRMNFDNKWFIPPDSHYTEVFGIVDDYFTSGDGAPFYVYTKGGDYSAAHVDGSLPAMYGRMRGCEWVQQELFNWYESFVVDPARAQRAKVSDTDFAKEVKQFVAGPSGARFAKDIVFIKDGDNVVGIKATRAFFQAKSTANGGEDVEFVQSVRDCAGEKPLEAFPFMGYFLYFDGFATIIPETTSNIIIALVCVLIVCTVLLGDFFAALLVVAMVGIVDLCLLGYMAHWNLDFNSVTSINIVIAVGLAVDYSAHIMHSFLAATGDRMERVKGAIDHIGASVMNGAFSTFIAVLPLGLSRSYVFSVFFKMWFLIVIFGSYMGLIVLPVLLRWIGPPSYGPVAEKEIVAATGDCKDHEHNVHDVSIVVEVTKAKEVPEPDAPSSSQGS
jgi:predicted RND superfamily exporter protein